MKQVFVGTFTEEDLKQGKDKVEVDIAKEKHGLKYTNAKLIKKGGEIVGLRIWVCDLEAFKI